jgi:hypothetical protein
MKLPRVVAATLITAACIISAACDTGRVVAPENDEPFLYLVLNHRSLSDYGGFSQFVQHGLLLTTGSVLESPRYRSAQRFEMRRLGEERFDWRMYENLITEPGTLTSLSLLFANYHLPDSATAAGLGTSDLAPGETYTLAIESEGELIRGATMIPDTFTVRIVRAREGDQFAVWPAVRGAGGYRVISEVEPSRLQRDTVFPLPSGGGANVQVEALDANLYGYLADQDISRAGIDNGFGVFGAVTPGRIVG